MCQCCFWMHKDTVSWNTSRLNTYSNFFRNRIATFAEDRLALRAETSVLWDLVTAAYSSLCLTIKHTNSNRLEFYFEHQPINRVTQTYIFHVLVFHLKMGIKCQCFTGILECNVFWYLWKNEREVPWKSQKGIKSFSVEAWRVALKGAQNKSAVKALLSCPLTPETEHLVIQVRTPHPLKGIKSGEPVEGKNKSANKNFIRTRKHKSDLSLWRHPSSSHYTIFELTKFAIFLPRLHRFHYVFIFTSCLRPTLISLDDEEDCNFCGHRTQPS